MPHRAFHTVWQLSLLSFSVAAATGILYRYGLLYPLPEWLHFANIRHAHSHLMFFNWVCPPVMIWAVSHILPATGNQPVRPFLRCFWWMILLGFLSYPFFLLYGYHSVDLGPASLPLAAILSGLVMITWYWFTWLYYRLRKKQLVNLPLRFFDAALAALLISSLGAWGVSLFQFTAMDSALIASALTHFFLALFTEGWALLGILGILWHLAGRQPLPVRNGWLWKPILIGAMLLFPYSLSESLITLPMLWSARIGTLLIASSLALNLALLIRTGRFKGFVLSTVLALIALKILFQFAALLPTGIWPGEHGLRVLYLHLLLLGILSILYMERFSGSRNPAPLLIFTGCVLLAILSLAMISGYWPAALLPPDLYHWVLLATALPLFPAAWIWIRELQAGTPPPRDPENNHFSANASP